DRSERAQRLEQMTRTLRDALRGIPGILVTHVGQLEPVSGQKRIEFSIMGPALQELDRISQELQSKLQHIPGLVDLDSSLRPPDRIVEVKVRREAAGDLGLSVASVANSLRTLVAGDTIGNWRASGDGT